MLSFKAHSCSHACMQKGELLRNDYCHSVKLVFPPFLKDKMSSQKKEISISISRTSPKHIFLKSLFQKTPKERNLIEMKNLVKKK